MKSKLWHSLDFLSHKPQIFVNGEKRYYTKLGVIFSGFSSIIMILAIYLILVNLFEVKIISFYEKFSFENQTLNFSIFFGIFYANGSKVDTNIVNYDLSVNNFSFSIRNMQTNITHGGGNATYLNSNNKSYYHIDYEFPLPKSLKIIEINISACKNSSLNNDSCFTKEKIKESLENESFYLEYLIPVYYFNHNILETPFFLDYHPVRKEIKNVKIIDNDNSLLNINNIEEKSFNHFKEDFTLVEYKTDLGNLLPNINTIYLIKHYFSEYKTNIDKYPQNILASLSIEINSKFTLKYFRSYGKILNTLADISGIIYLILSVFRTFIENFTIQVMVTDFSNKFIWNDVQKDNNSFHLRTSKEMLDNHHNIHKFNSADKKNSKSTMVYTYELCDILPINKRKKEMNNKLNHIIRGKLSSDYIFKMNEEFQKLKKFMMDKKQNTLFEITKNKTISQHLEDFLKIARKYDSSEVEECFDEVRRRTDVLSRALIKEFMMQ
jgi:hypothetical protein